MALDTIYNAIAGWSVSVNGKTATAYKPGTTPEQLHTADLPARIIMPMHAPTEGAQTTVRNFGGGLSLTWELEDVLLFTPVGQGDSLASKVQDLTGYIDSYLTAYQGNYKVSEAIWFKDAKFAKAVLEYPEGSGRDYFGVITTLTITEQR